MIPRAAALVLVLALALASCVPWTVRPIDDTKDKPAANPAALADSVWAAVLSSAVDARAVLANPPNARYVTVKGEGVITAVDRTSRTGLALISVPPEISIQIGPVLRGTSLRDATGLVRFSDFTNQLQYADAANALNDRVLKTVLAPVENSLKEGERISFVGTAEPSLREIVPVKLTVEERRP